MDAGWLSQGFEPPKDMTMVDGDVGKVSHWRAAQGNKQHTNPACLSCFKRSLQLLREKHLKPTMRAHIRPYTGFQAR